jgi:hypothetical protein
MGASSMKEFFTLLSPFSSMRQAGSPPKSLYSEKYYIERLLNTFN